MFWVARIFWLTEYECEGIKDILAWATGLENDIVLAFWLECVAQCVFPKWLLWYVHLFQGIATPTGTVCGSLLPTWSALCDFFSLKSVEWHHGNDAVWLPRLGHKVLHSFSLVFLLEWIPGNPASILGRSLAHMGNPLRQEPCFLVLSTCWAWHLAPTGHVSEPPWSGPSGC